MLNEDDINSKSRMEWGMALMDYLYHCNVSNVYLLPVSIPTRFYTLSLYKDLLYIYTLY